MKGEEGKSCQALCRLLEYSANPDLNGSIKPQMRMSEK